MSHLEKGSLQIDYLKVLKMRSSWLIQVGPEPNNRYLIRDRYRGEGDVKTEQREVWPQAKECQQPQRLGQATKASSLEASEGEWLC